MNLLSHLNRQKSFSLETFGPGNRSQGIVNHIRKELAEIEAQPTDIEEWVDVILLALDGAWRSGASCQEVCDAIQIKQAKNERRTWPDWQTLSHDSPIEHIKST